MSAPSRPSQKRPTTGVSGSALPAEGRNNGRTISHARGPCNASVAMAARPGGVKQAIQVMAESPRIKRFRQRQGPVAQTNGKRQQGSLLPSLRLPVGKHKPGAQRRDHTGHDVIPSLATPGLCLRYPVAGAPGLCLPSLAPGLCLPSLALRACVSRRWRSGLVSAHSCDSRIPSSVIVGQAMAPGRAGASRWVSPPVRKMAGSTPACRR